MSNSLTYRLVFCMMSFMLITTYGYAQPASNPYYFEGEDVVFVFDIRNYARALKGKDADKVDFKDLNIYDVAVTGQFNDWSKEGWKMTKKSEFVFELRKRVEDFKDPFPLEFKYIINGKILSDPIGQQPDGKQYSDQFIEDIYHVDLSVIKINERGNTVFYLKDHLNAQQVILSGSFNGWNETALKMKKGADGWTLRADLPPGRYEYKFIVDGVWFHDKANKVSVTNEHGTQNSVLLVNKFVEFTLEGFPNAKKVILTGSFANWHESKHSMSLVNGVWKINLPIPGGKHHYKFIVDGQWLTDPANPIIEDDGYGNLNSVLFVH